MKQNSLRIIGIGAIVVIVLGIIVIAVAKKPASSNPATATATATNAVTLSNFSFGPMVITVKAGTVVTWTNQDSVHHSVTIDSGDGPSSPLFGQGETYTYTFAKAGTYTYHCMPHPYMHGTVVVTE